MNITSCSWIWNQDGKCRVFTTKDWCLGRHEPRHLWEDLDETVLTVTQRRTISQCFCAKNLLVVDLAEELLLMGLYQGGRTEGFTTDLENEEERKKAGRKRRDGQIQGVGRWCDRWKCLFFFPPVTVFWEISHSPVKLSPNAAGKSWDNFKFCFLLTFPSLLSHFRGVDNPSLRTIPQTPDIFKGKAYSNLHYM